MPMTSRLVFGLLSCATVLACHKSSSDTRDNAPVETTAATISAPAQAPPVIVNVPQEQPPAVNVTINNPPPQQAAATGGGYVTGDTNATGGTTSAPAQQPVQRPAQAQQVYVPAYTPPQTYTQAGPLPMAQTQPGQQGQIIQPQAPTGNTPAPAGYTNGAANPPTNPAQPSGGYTGIGGGSGYTGVGGGSGYTGVGGGSGFTGIGGGGSSMSVDGG